MAIGVGVAVGQNPKAARVEATDPDVTFTPSNCTSMSSTAGEQEQTLGQATLNIGNGVNNTELRIYKNATATISVPNTYDLKKIVFTCTASGTTKYGPGCFAAHDGYTYNDTVGTWEGTAKSVALTASSNQVRATSIEVWYQQASSDPDVVLSVSSFSMATTDANGKSVSAEAVNLTSASYSWAIQSGSSYVSLVNPTNTSSITIKPKGNSSGDATVRVTATGTNGSAYKDVTVHVVAPGTVSALLTALESSDSIENVFTKGIISSTPSVETDANKGYANYYISDDGTETNQLYIYHGYYLQKAKFTSSSQIKKGDEVTIFGNAIVYNETKEYASGNELVSLKHQPDITLSESTLSINTGGSDNSVAVSTSDFSGAVSYSFTKSGDDVLASYSVSNGVLNVTAKESTGTAVLTVTATYNTEVASASITITVKSISGVIASGRYIIHNGSTAFQAKAYTSSTSTEVANTAAKAWDFKLVDTNKYEITTVVESTKYWLYCTSSSTGLRTATTAHTWTITTNSDGYAVNSDDQTTRYITYYSTGKDWRSYASLNKVYLTEEKDMFANNFLTEFTKGCNAAGSYTEANMNWTGASTQFGYLSTANQDVFKNATYTKTGTGSDTVVTPGEGVANNVANVVAKYDYIVGKYGTSTFADFMQREPAPISGGAATFSIPNETNATTTFIVIIAAVSTLAIGGFFFLRKRKIG